MAERPPFRPEPDEPDEVPAAPQEIPIPDSLMQAAFGHREVARTMQDGLARLAEKAKADGDDKLKKTVEAVMAGDLSPRALLAHGSFLERFRANAEAFRQDMATLDDEERKEFDERARELAESLRARMPATWFPTIGLEAFGFGENGQLVPPVTPKGMPDGGAMIKEFMDDVEKGL